MKPRMCKVKHDPPKQYSDCITACVASLVDDDDVPHAYTGDNPDKAWDAIQKHLQKSNMTLLFSAFEEHPGEFMKFNNPDTYYILLHQNSDEEDHAIICKNDKVDHNPAWCNKPIKGPHSVGVWVVIMIGVHIT